MSKAMLDDDLQNAYAAHLQRLDELVSEISPDKPLIFHSGSAKKKSNFDDQYYPFVPNGMFSWWIPEGDADWFVVSFDGKRELFVTARDVVWESAWPIDPLAQELFEVREFRTLEATVSALPVGVLVTDSGSATWFSGEGAGSQVLERLAQHRAVKDRYELACLKRANERALPGHEVVANLFQASPKVSEFDLQAEYLLATGQTSFSAPYGSIVALNRNAAVLHHDRYEHRAVMGPASLLIDAGATIRGYHSDITRTYVRGEDEDAMWFERLIQSLEQVQANCISDVAVGASYEWLHERSHEYLANEVRAVGLSSASVDELVGDGWTRVLFPHGLGHGLGLQVHDVGYRPGNPGQKNKFLRNTSVMAEGHVVTIEPGCYFIETLLEPKRELGVLDWNLVDRVKGFGGIRIEDNIAIIGGKTCNLTRDNNAELP